MYSLGLWIKTGSQGRSGDQQSQRKDGNAEPDAIKGSTAAKLEMLNDMEDVSEDECLERVGDGEEEIHEEDLWG